MTIQGHYESPSEGTVILVREQSPSRTPMRDCTRSMLCPYYHPQEASGQARLS